MASIPESNDNNTTNVTPIDLRDETNAQTKIYKSALCSKNLVCSKIVPNERDLPVEELLGSVTTFNNAQGGTEQALRTSARVIKKLQQDSLVNVNNDRDKKEIKIEEKPDNKPKPKLPKASWSMMEKTLFFEALNEFGKDFESVAQYISGKMKRRGVSDNFLKTKDQVRHFYYRSWNKISKFISFNTDVKKVVQELYLLINYGEMRKKIFLINEKTALKLGELIYRGSVPLRMKGKTFRIKTPMCKALRKLNEMEEWQEELKLPTRVMVILQPSNVEAWHRVQSVAHNPRVTALIPIQRRLSNLLFILNERWKTYDTKLLQKLTDVDECATTNKNPSAELLHFGPKPGVHINKPIINLSEYISSNRICLNSYEERLGITEKSEMIFSRTIQNFKGGGSKKGAKRQRSESGSDKKNLESNNENPNKKLKFEIESPENKIKENLETPAQVVENDQNTAMAWNLDTDVITISKINTDPIAKVDHDNDDLKNKISLLVMSQNMNDAIDQNLVPDLTETNVTKSAPNSNSKEIKVENMLLMNHNFIKDDKNNLPSQQKSEVKTKIKDKVKVVRKRPKIISNKRSDKESESKIQDTIKYGWTLEDATGVTFGDLYLMFGSNSKIQLEYWWDRVNKPLLDENESDSTTKIDNDISKDSIAIELKEQDKSSKNQCENISKKTNEYSIISDMPTLCTYKNNNNAVSLNESEQVEKTAHLTRRLKQLLLCLQTNEKPKRNTCICGHVCNEKLISNQSSNNMDLNNDYQINTSHRTVGPVVRDNSIFRQPFPITMQPDNFEKQINSLIKVKPRWNNRQNRFMGSKPVVHRNPNSSTNNYLNYSQSNSGHQARIVASRQLNFGADAAHNYPRKMEFKSVIDESKKHPNFPVNSYMKSNNKQSTFIKNKIYTKPVTCTVVKNDEKTVETVVEDNDKAIGIVDKNTQVTKEIRPEKVNLDLVDNISIGSSTIADVKASILRSDHLDELLNTSRVPESLNSCILNTPENTWFNSELHDFSLSSFLGHLESPIKPQVTHSEENRISQDADVNLQSLLNENSEDYMAKFAALAARISNENTNK